MGLQPTLRPRTQRRGQSNHSSATQSYHLQLTKLYVGHVKLRAYKSPAPASCQDNGVSPTGCQKIVSHGSQGTSSAYQKVETLQRRGLSRQSTVKHLFSSGEGECDGPRLILVVACTTASYPKRARAQGSPSPDANSTETVRQDTLPVNKYVPLKGVNISPLKNRCLAGDRCTQIGGEQERSLVRTYARF